MFLLLPERKRYGCGLLLYAISVSLATVYGRYHYAVDAIAGFAVSLTAGILFVAMSSASKGHLKVG
jgi:membrane-associated phospholipid phosphatase